MEVDKEFIQKKVAQFRAKRGQPQADTEERAEVDNVAEPTETLPPTPSNTPNASGSDGLDDSASSEDDQAKGVERVLANIVELKCT